MDILLQERSLKTLKIPSGFSYLTLYDSPKRPIEKWERGPKVKGPLSRVHMCLGTRRVPQPSAGARRRVAVGHPNLLVILKDLY